MNHDSRQAAAAIRAAIDDLERARAAAARLTAAAEDRLSAVVAA